MAENLKGQQSRDHTIRQDARVVEYDFWRQKMHAHKRKVLAKHFLFLLRPVIQYRTWKIKKNGGGVLLSSRGGKNIEKLISGGRDVYLAPKSTKL